MAATQPLLSEPEATEGLLATYAHDELFAGKIRRLATTHPSLRRTRGDGNCFYRATTFALLEQLMGDKEEMARVQALLPGTFQTLLDLGYPQMTSEDFFEMFADTVEEVKSGQTADTAALAAVFNDDGVSSYLVVYARMIVSGYLQTHCDDFQPFMDDGVPVKDFCSREVDPVGREADHLQVQAMAKALGIRIAVSYLDRVGFEMLLFCLRVSSLSRPGSRIPHHPVAWRRGHHTCGW